MGADAHPVIGLLVFARVCGLVADRLWIDQNKLFDLLLARTGSNEDDESECCQKLDVL